MESRHPDPALQLARAALAAAPAALLTDLDGTLAPIVDDPAAARALPGSGEALARLAANGVLVGVVSGRAALDARRILGRDDVLVIGNHGLEWLEAGAAEPAVVPEAAAARAAIDRALAAVPPGPGVVVEDKGLSATIHFRSAPDPASAAARARAALEAAAVPGVVLRSGRLSLELRPAGAGDKGSAVLEVARRHALRGLVVIGDDVTDLDMFRAAHHLRDEDGLRVAVLAVGGAGEVSAEVAAAADATLPHPEAVVGLLRTLAGDAA